MHLRKLGSTSLDVTPVGLGLAALGRPGYINLNHATDLNANYDVAAMEANTHAVLDAAWEAGIRYFDAARSYGRAEAFLGSWLRSREIMPDAVTVGSKWGYTYTAGWQVEAEKHEIKEHSIDVLDRQWRETQSHLGAYLNLYQIHSATLESGVLDNHRVLARLAELKANGTAIGLSVSGPKQGEVLRRAMATSIDGARLFDTVQITWNLLEPSTSEALHDAKSAGMGVIVKEALANGRLTPRNDEADFADKYALLVREAKRLNTTVDALALAAALAQPWCDLVLSGAARTDHLRSNVAALDVAWDFDATTALIALKEPPEQYWATRSALAWN